MGIAYTPTTRPGHRLPHAWLNNRGKRVSTHDVGGVGKFILLTGPGGKAWCEAAARLSTEPGVPIETCRIAAGGDIGDPTRSWAKLSEGGVDGALLVRPGCYSLPLSGSCSRPVRSARDSSYDAISIPS